MALPFDIANFNLVNFAESYNDLFDSVPKNVSIQVKDSNGNITTKTVANRGLFKQQIWDDVGAAIGQFSRTFYVDQVNGDDNNDGTETNPFKTLKKAIDSCPKGGSVRVRLLSDALMSNEPSTIYFQGKHVVIELRNNKLIQDTTTNMFYCADFYGYLKIYSSNGYSGTIELQTDVNLIRIVDSVGDVVIGDYDSTLTVNYTGSTTQTLLWSARSRAMIHAIKTTFNGNGVAVCKIASKDYDDIDAITHATCVLNNVVTVYANEFRIPRNSWREGKIRYVHIDPVNGSDFNPGTESQPLKTFDELVGRIGYFADKRIVVLIHNDITINNWLSITNTNIEMSPYDTTNPPTITFESQDNNGDGIWVQSLNLYNSVLTLRCPTRFVNPNSSSATVSNVINVAYGSTLQINSYSVDVKMPVYFGDYTNSILNSNGNKIMFWSCDFSFGANESHIINGTGTFNIKVDGCTIDGGTFDTATFASHLYGIVKDANGIPRNFVSNLVI